MSEFVIALAGNPNVGKSTVFNELTGLNQHTGNWSGKTVESAEGRFIYNDKKFRVVDLPGIYSFYSDNAEEKAAKDFVCSEKADMVLCIADASNLERSLNICFQAMDLYDDVVLCLNLMDEAQKHGISVNKYELERLMNIPVICTSARYGKGIEEIKKTAYDVCEKKLKIQPFKAGYADKTDEERSIKYMELSEKTSREVCVKDSRAFSFQHRADSIILSKKYGIPLIIAVLALLFLITAKVSNYPSQFIGYVLELGETKLKYLLDFAGISPWLKSLIIDGIFNTTAFVVSVMLPPMAVFFPLFTFLEDCGFLPRVAYNLDKPFKKCNACGKQSLTMCMGFGCNAVGVTGCRIIDSKRERILAILTNSFVPCNGRFPTLIAIISMFFIGSSIGI